MIAGCATGAPTGFSAGDRWVVPLIGPMEDGLLLVPAYVDGKGPYIFAIDPDANVSIVDDKIVKEAGLRSGQGPRLDDENDKQHEQFYAEVLQLQIGRLTVQRKSALIVKTGTYDVDGRVVDGVLGRDVIADSLVFGFDRDAGVVTLETQEAWSRERVTGGTSLHYELLPELLSQDVDVVPVSRRLVDAMIDGVKLVVHLDFGAKSSQLRERSWDKAHLAVRATTGGLVDESGTGRPISKLGVAAQVSVGTLSTPDVAFVPYIEHRWPDEDLEGALGLDFFRPYTAWIDWNAQTIRLLPRREPTAGLAERLARWQLKGFASCTAPGCVTATLIDPLAGKPADQRPAQHPGVVATFARDPAATGTPLEALVSARAADGTPLATFVVGLPVGVDRAMTHLPPEYVGATLTVIDADPFPRACPAAGGCVDVLAPST